MNLWNSLTNWIDNWFNTNYLKFLKLNKFIKYNSSYLNKLTINNTKCNYLLIKYLNTNLLMNKHINLVYISLTNNYNINNLICISRCKLNTYKFNVK